MNLIKKVISNNLTICLVIFFLSFFAFTGTMYFFYTTDSLPNNYTALNIIFHKRLDLNNYQKTLGRLEPFITIKNKNGTVFAKTPPIMGILSVPTFWVLNKYYGVKYLTEEQIVKTDYSQLIGKLSASFYCSLSAVLMFFILLKLNKNKWQSFLMTLVYFLCTNIFNTASQANFQHGISLFFINLFLLIFISNPKRNPTLIICGLIAGLFTQLRISNGFYVVFIIMYFILFRKELKYKFNRLALFFIPFLLSYGVIFAMNRYFHIPNGYGGEFIESIKEFRINFFIENIIALLFSFNYGLFFFSPILLLGFISILKLFKEKNQTKEEKLIISLLPILVMFVVFASAWWIWTGGRSLNARLITEAAPILIILLNYSYRECNKSYFYKFILAFFFFISFSVNILTTYFIDPTMRWYDTYTVHQFRKLKITRHETQMRNAWLMKPTLFAYILKTKWLRIVRFYKQGDKLISQEVIFRPSLKYLNLRKISDTKKVILDLSPD